MTICDIGRHSVGGAGPIGPIQGPAAEHQGRFHNTTRD